MWCWRTPSAVQPEERMLTGVADAHISSPLLIACCRGRDFIACCSCTGEHPLAVPFKLCAWLMWLSGVERYQLASKKVAQPALV